MTDFQVSGPVFVATGHDEASMQVAVDAVRHWVAFYGSTPAYRNVLETHGWGDLQTELHALSRDSRWTDMKALIDDEVLHQFAVVAAPDRVPDEIRRRYAGRVDRISFNAPYPSHPDVFPSILRALKQ